MNAVLDNDVPEPPTICDRIVLLREDATSALDSLDIARSPDGRGIEVVLQMVVAALDEGLLRLGAVRVAFPRKSQQSQ